jgi:hypothetical protein
VAGQDRPFDAESVEQWNHVGCEVLDGVSRCRLVGLTVPALRHGDRAYLLRQEIEEELIRPP